MFSIKKILSIVGVISGAVVITALGIDASDTFRGNDGTLLSQVIESENGGCPSGMTRVETVPGVRCVDMYEASADDTCPVSEPRNVVDSVTNINSSECKAVSKQSVEPWRFVSREQAMQACSRAGKRLPTSEEWYQLAQGIGNIDATCNIRSGKMHITGAGSNCVTPAGANDMVGNVWEWVMGDVVDGTHEGQMLAEEGYVAGVNALGMAIDSTSTEQMVFGEDYFWSRPEGTFGIIRGGFYDSGTDAGIYSVHADTKPTAVGTAIGFRCIL